MIKILTILLLLLLILSCERSQRKTSDTGETLKGEHILRKINIYNEEKKVTNGSFFLGIGTIYQNNISIDKIRFSWLTNKGNYAISEFYLHSVRIKFDSTSITPYVTFNWNRGSINDLDINSYSFYKSINYIVINCREEDYILDINIENVK